MESHNPLIKCGEPVRVVALAVPEEMDVDAFDDAAVVCTDMELTLVTPTSGAPPTIINGCHQQGEENGRLPDVVVEAKLPIDGDDASDEDGANLGETYFSIAIQVFIPFLIAGFGMVFAGLVFDKIQVFVNLVA